MTARRGTRIQGAEEDSSGSDPKSVVRSEEALRTGTVSRPAGVVRVRKRVEEQPVEKVVPRTVEQVQVERMETDDGDSGLVETLPDGSISIPVFEERLVIEKKLVVRERVIVRKVMVTEDRQVDVKLRRERVEIDADPEVASRVQDAEHSPPSGNTPTTAVTTEPVVEKQSRSRPVGAQAKHATVKKAAAQRKPNSSG